MNVPVPYSELRETVERMEQRLRQEPNDLSARLMAIYDKLVSRFRNDLRDDRDEMLSRAAALMLVQEFLHDQQTA